MKPDRLMADCGIEQLDADGVSKLRAVVMMFLRQGKGFDWDYWCQLNIETQEIVVDCANRLSLERSAVEANLFWGGPKAIVEAVAVLDGGKTKAQQALQDAVDTMAKEDKKPEGAE